MSLDQDEIAALPEKYRPLSAWGYFGYTILYSIPLIGLVFLIVFSLSDKNINRRSFSRSYFCVLILSLIVCGVLFATGMAASLLSMPAASGIAA